MNLRLSLPMAGAVAGVVVGLLDAAILPFSLRTRGAPLLPPGPWTSLAVIWTWVTILAVIGVLFSAQRLHRIGAIAMLLAGPGLLLLSRASEPLKFKTNWSSPVILLTWAGLLALLAIPLLKLRFRPTRGWGWWAGAGVISSALLVFSASEMRAADWLPVRDKRAAGHRNVVLIFLDTTRADDARREMPNLARFAQSAISFDEAWAPSSWTVPSHFAVLTGVDPWRVPFDAEARRFTEAKPMLAQRFRARGYSTSAILSNFTVAREAGFGAGYDEFTTSRESGICRSGIGDILSRLWLHDLPRPPLCNWLKASEITDRAVRFIRRTERPYFLTLNYLDPHDPYYVPSGCLEKESFRPWRRADRLAFVNTYASWPPQVLDRAHGQYRAALRCMDHSLGTLFAALERDPDYATTTVAIVGDHGELFGEFGLINHGISVYRPVLHVPLLLRAPGETARHIGDAVSITDIHDTLLQILEPQRMTGPLKLLAPQRRRPVVASYGMITGQRSMFSAVVGNYQLILRRDGEEKFFDIRSGAAADPQSQPAIVAEARTLIAKEIAAQRGGGEFRALGYMQ